MIPDRIPGQRARAGPSAPESTETGVDGIESQKSCARLLHDENASHCAAVFFGSPFRDCLLGGADSVLQLLAEESGCSQASISSLALIAVTLFCYSP